MDKYNYLHDIFNLESRSAYDKEVKQRMDGYGIIKIEGFKIKPHKYPGEFSLFFYCHTEMMKKAEKISRDSDEIKKISRKIPGIAKESYQINTLVEEMQGTNEIEGVRSSRAEMNEGLRKIIDEGEEPIRHKSLIKSYLKLQQSKLDTLDKPEDIREIYDYLVSEEIKEGNKLDGELFRIDPAELTKSNTEKVIHVNNMGEVEIKQELAKLISLLNGDSLPELYKIAIGHFLFGYIHPFYDGNGRTSRYISSIYLRKLLNPITSLSLSKACKDNLKLYLDAFANTNSFKSAGDLTYFIDSFFDILINEQRDIISDLKEKREQLEQISRILKSDDNFDVKEEAMLYMLFQEFIYGEFSEGLTKQDIIKYGKTSFSSVYRFNKTRESLIRKEAIKEVKKKPITLTINPSYFGISS